LSFKKRDLAMEIPKNLLYTKEHEWAKIENQIITIGITDFAQSQLGDIIFLELPKLGDSISDGEVFGEIEAVKTVSELYSPVSGKVIEVNHLLGDQPQFVNNDCYNDGWLIKVSTSNRLEYKNLLNPDDYSKLIK
tara:strand:- start:1901 stop:2305 length:405 start_codon:yes stop_codon:yes gene_type:complete